MLGDKNDRKDSIYSFFIFMHKRIYALCVLVCECENTYVCKISWTPQPQYAYMFILEDNLRSTYSRGVHLNYNYHFFLSRQSIFSHIFGNGRYPNLTGQWTGDLCLSSCVGMTTAWILLNFTKCVLSSNSNLFAFAESIIYVSPLPILIICFQLF